jgi:hypothetical protein
MTRTTSHSRPTSSRLPRTLIAGWLAWAACQPPSGAAATPVVPPTEASSPETELAEGAKLAAQLRASPPAEEINYRGRLNIRESSGRIVEVPFHFRGVVTPTNWLTIYSAEAVGTNAPQLLAVMHSPDKPNSYWGATPGSPDSWQALPPPAATQPFAGSDFTLQDLGLEFLHWPTQRVLRTEMRKGRPCRVLQSSQPPTSTNGYGRVVSWVDVESGGLLIAEAYDPANRLLKEFSINKVTKVDGRWQVEKMEIRNPQARTRTQLDFELK